MQFYHSKYNLIRGEGYAEIERAARKIFNQIAKTTKRQPYVRSAYFHKEKVFLKLFWNHLAEKRMGERQHRLAFYACAIDLIENSRIEPETTKLDTTRETYYRFYGQAKNGATFCVQIKQEKNGGKFHMSVFPSRKGGRS